MDNEASDLEFMGCHLTLAVVIFEIVLSDLFKDLNWQNRRSRYLVRIHWRNNALWAYHISYYNKVIWSKNLPLLWAPKFQFLSSFLLYCTRSYLPTRLSLLLVRIHHPIANSGTRMNQFIHSLIERNSDLHRKISRTPSCGTHYTHTFVQKLSMSTHFVNKK